MPNRRAPRPVKPLAKQARDYDRSLREAYLDPLLQDIRQRWATVASVNQAHWQMTGAVRALERLPYEGVPMDLVKAELAKIDGYHRQQMFRSFRAALGVDIRPLLQQDPGVRLFMDRQIRANVDLIKTIPPRLHDSLETRLATQFADRPFDQAALRTILQQEYRSSGWNLRRLTRDQTNKTIGGLTRIRQQQAQVTRYRWVSAGDNRVREEHQRNHDNIFEWAKPPDTGHPGTAILCRCVAEPVIDRLPAETRPAPSRPQKPKALHAMNADEAVAYLRQQQQYGDIASLRHTWEESARSVRSLNRDVLRDQKNVKNLAELISLYEGMPNETDKVFFSKSRLKLLRRNLDEKTSRLKKLTATEQTNRLKMEEAHKKILDELLAPKPLSRITLQESDLTIPKSWSKADRARARLLATEGLAQFQRMVKIDLPDGFTIRANITRRSRRARWKPTIRTMQVSPDDELSTHIHEWGHMIEQAQQSRLQKSVDFLERRARNDAKFQRIKDIDGYHYYPADEKTMADEFSHPYIGRVYEGWGSKQPHVPNPLPQVPFPRIGATEISSMGLDMMYEDAYGFLQKDEDFFRFVWTEVMNR